MECFKIKKELAGVLSFLCILFISGFLSGCSSALVETSAEHAVKPELSEDGSVNADLTLDGANVDWSEHALAVREQAFFHYKRGVQFFEKGDIENSEREMEAALDVILDADTRPELHRELVQLYNEFFDRVERFKRDHFPADDNGFKNRIAQDIDGDLDANGYVTDSAEDSLQGCSRFSEIPMVFNNRVQHFIEFLTVTNKAKTERSLSRGTRYIDFMRKILKEEGIPEDFVYLVLIESAFKTNAYSSAHACGLWQFIKATGRRYNLDVSWWVDERRDPEKATRAAAHYLKDLYAEFHCWLLSVASYNTGEARVRKAIAQSGSRDIWTIIHEQRIPRQTRNYVPAFLAAIEVGKHPEKYGLEISPEEPYLYDEVKIHDSVDLRVIAKCCATDYETIKELNPELRKFYTPKLQSGYSIKIPHNHKNQFLLAYSKLSEKDKLSWSQHEVRHGETLSSIASRYGVTVTDLMYANNLHNAHFIRTGIMLLIPSGPNQKPPASYANVRASSSTRATRSTAYADYSLSHSNSQKLRYRVVRGDNLYSIAMKFGTTITQICQWNNINKWSTLYPGTMLTLYGADMAVSGEQADEDSNTEDTAQTAETGDSQQVTSSERNVCVHVIQYGDTLYNIAKNYGVTIDQIKEWNNIKSQHNIYPGDRLHIYGNAEQTADSSDDAPAADRENTYHRKITYLVKAGDTLWDIAKSFNTFPEKIRMWNKPRNLQVIRPGDKLTIFVN